MNKKRILFIINDLLPGGAQRVVLDIARNLNRNLFDVHVIALRDVADVRSAKGDLVGLFVKYGVSYEILGWKKSLTIAGFKALIGSIKRFNPDISHMHLPYSIIVGTIASKIAGVRYLVAHEHNTDEFDPWRIKALRFFTDKFLSLVICYTDIVEKAIYGGTHVLMKEEDYLRFLSPLPHSLTIYNGIDTKRLLSLRDSLDREAARELLHVSPGQILVLATGRLISWKGHEHLIRSFAHVVNERKDISLRIIGYGPLENHLKNLIRDLHLEEHVALLGLRTDAQELLVSADIFSNVYTYDDNTLVKEALGVSGLEALASGIPTIVGFHPSANKFVTNNLDAYVVDPKDEVALARAIVELASDPARRKELGQNASKNMQETFDWSNIARRYEQVYTLLCK